VEILINGNGGDDPEVQVLLKIPQYDDDQDYLVDVNSEKDNKIKVEENMAFEKSNTKAVNPSKDSCHKINSDDSVGYKYE